MKRNVQQFRVAFLVAAAAALPLSSGVFAQVSARKPVVTQGGVPRTPDGKPDLQGNWTNETQTPVERLGNGPLILTDAEARAIESRAQLVEEYRDQASNPDRATPPAGGDPRSLVAPGQPSFIEQITAAAAGGVGGYNGFWLAPGTKVIRIDGEARSSIIIDPPNGRIPALTPEGQKRVAAAMAAQRRFGESDNPEGRTLSDRCLISFGSNAGPPMLPNYFYNNNYTIVQTKDHVVIFTEMVHDARIIRLGASSNLPSQMPSWFGDSIGRWEGDTLVIETANIHPAQLAQSGPLWAYRGASPSFKVTEWITRSGPDTLRYKFRVEDPVSLTAPFTGELPFNRLDEPIYEYACHEGNHAMKNILAGARLADQEGASQQR
jgi:hypothetical protein